MTNWEQWLKEHHRKDIICAVEERCNKDCILFSVCSGYGDTQENHNACDEFLDAEALPNRSEVILNLASMRDEASINECDWDVKILSRAIELLEEVDE